MCIVAIFVTYIAIVYRPDTENWGACKTEANVVCNSESGSVASGGRRLMDRLVSQRLNGLKFWGEETFVAQMGLRRKLFLSQDVVYSQCTSQENVCSVDTDGNSETTSNKISCFNGTTCSSNSLSVNTCQAATSNTNECFAKVAAEESGRTDDGCCAGVCGTDIYSSGDLKHAKCEVDTSGKFVEECTCSFSYYTTDFGVCKESSHNEWKTETKVNSQGAEIGISKCKYLKELQSSDYKGNSTCYATDCKSWAQCRSNAFCDSSSFINATNASYATVHLLLLIGSMIIVGGMLPICVGGMGKATGNDDMGNICGGIGCCSSVFFTGCGGTIMVFIPFVFGAFLQAACDIFKANVENFKATCSEEGASSCGEVMDAEFKHICAVGHSLVAASVIQIVAQVFGLIAVIFTVVGWCNQKKQKTPQTTVVKNAPQVLSANGQVLMVATPQVVKATPVVSSQYKT